jgi:hypothetical protein
MDPCLRDRYLLDEVGTDILFFLDCKKPELRILVLSILADMLPKNFKLRTRIVRRRRYANHSYTTHSSNTNNVN